MSGCVPNLVNVRGEVQRVPVRKRKADTYAERAGRVAAEAIREGATHFAIRIDHVWRIYPVSGPVTHPTLDGLTEAAAAMWLQYRGRKT